MRIDGYSSLGALTNVTNGLNAGVYFDYCSQKSLVTFQGTNARNIRDVLKDWMADFSNNLSQYAAGISFQYEQAMLIGDWMRKPF